MRHLTPRRLPPGTTPTVYGTGDGWTGPLILRPLVPPPAHLIEQPGGRLVTVKNPLGSSPHQQHPALILAWAPMPDDGWACLLAWDGYRLDAAGRELPSARWSWVEFERDLVSPLRPWLPDQPRELRWFGRPAGGALEAAHLEAAGSLPKGMRDAALGYTPGAGPDDG